jgi:cell wall-associated NlpC family hydrolase
VYGRIFSFLQKDKTGPITDENHSAAKEIKRLTEMDFPQTDLTISNDGFIERKSELTVNTIQDDSALLTEDIINYSKQFLGKNYRRGAKGPNAFDCSGFTSFVFNKFGYRLSPSCITQVNEGQRVGVQELKRGDLIFFKGRNAKLNRVGHVGIVIANDEGNVTFIHACRRGVIIDELAGSTYYKPRYVTGLRVLDVNS